ncbi:MAG: hypothetical protein JXQ82_03485 [Methanomicrobiaceae archaeon]|nr:hypothetical protein [Methanomicrobiaceae archaeon]
MAKPKALNFLPDMEITQANVLVYKQILLYLSKIFRKKISKNLFGLKNILLIKPGDKREGYTYETKYSSDK